VKNSAKPGAVIKAVRLRNKWTLADVSAKTGITISTFSKIENDKVSLNYEKLALISKGMGIGVSQLFSLPEQGGNGVTAVGRRSLNKNGEGMRVQTAAYSQTYPATDLLRKHFVPVIAELRARSIEEFGELVRRNGEEYTYVLHGRVDFHSEIYAPIRLEVGDSIYFDSGMGHAYIAASDGACRVLSICSGEEAQIVGSMSLQRRGGTPVTHAATKNRSSSRGKALRRKKRRAS
jgi:transcriptional regulator with XRE-family HTH domain